MLISRLNTQSIKHGCVFGFLTSAGFVPVFTFIARHDNEHAEEEIDYIPRDGSAEHHCGDLSREAQPTVLRLFVKKATSEVNMILDAPDMELIPTEADDRLPIIGPKSHEVCRDLNKWLGQKYFSPGHPAATKARTHARKHKAPRKKVMQ